jgi:O-antigen/teichoic acid export membrane protein
MKSMTEAETPGTPVISSLTKTIFKNTVFITGGNLALKLLNFLFTVYVIRRLGDDRYGQYMVVLAFVGLFQIFAELGISQFVMREISQDHSKTQKLFWNLVALRFLLGLLGMVIITIGAMLSGYSRELIFGIFLYTTSFLLAAFQVPLSTVLTAHERFDYVTAIGILGQIVFAVFGALFLFSGLGFLWLIVASIISFFPQIVIGTWAVWKNNLLTREITIDPSEWGRLVRRGLPFGLISLTLVIAFSIDTVMLKHWYTDNVVGWYNVAYNLVFSMSFLMKGFKDAIVPSLSRTYLTQPDEVKRWYYRTVKAGLLLGLPVAVGGMLVARPLIGFLYTPEFTPSALALMILIWDAPFLIYTSFCGNMTTVISEEKAAARIYGLNAAANVVLNLIAIPRWGFLGAAVVTVITDLIGAVQFHLLFEKKLGVPGLGSILWKTSAASLLMGLIVYLMRGMNLFVMIGAGVVAFAVFVLAFRIVDESEKSLLLRVWRKLVPSSTTTGAP